MNPTYPSNAIQRKMTPNFLQAPRLPAVDPANFHVAGAIVG
jgi:hypothetical protein